MLDEDYGVTLHAMLQIAILCLALVGCSRVVLAADATEQQSMPWVERTIST
jgi:hypothetical protein